MGWGPCPAVPVASGLWSLVLDLVKHVKSLELQNTVAATRVNTRSSTVLTQTDNPEGYYVSRERGAKLHHWDELKEYIYPDELAKYQALRDANPCQREHRHQPRRRDRTRADGKVRNPIYTSYSLCLVCKYQYGVRKETLRYCRGFPTLLQVLLTVPPWDISLHRQSDHPVGGVRVLLTLVLMYKLGRHG